MYLSDVSLLWVIVFISPVELVTLLAVSACVSKENVLSDK